MNYKEAILSIEEKTKEIWMDMPDDLKLIKWGFIKGGAGTGKQYFTCLVLMETYTLMLGQRLLFPFMLMTKKEEISIEALKAMTMTAIKESFNPSLFLGDLGLLDMEFVGKVYLETLQTLTTKLEYIELTGAYCTYANRMHRWVHHIFPWNIGLGSFPQRDIEEIKEINRLLEKGICR